MMSASLVYSPGPSVGTHLSALHSIDTGTMEITPDALFSKQGMKYEATPVTK